MANIAYLRVSTANQSTASQEHELNTAEFDRVFSDVGVSGTVAAAERPEFSKLMDYIREGDSLTVYSVDRLGRDALDVQLTVKALQDKGVRVVIHDLGLDTGSEVGGIMLVLLAKLGEMERAKILARTKAGREKAQAEGKQFGRPQKVSAEEVKEMRDSGMSLTQIASALGVTVQTVCRKLKQGSK